MAHVHVQHLKVNLNPNPNPTPTHVFSPQRQHDLCSNVMNVHPNHDLSVMSMVSRIWINVLPFVEAQRGYFVGVNVHVELRKMMKQ